MVSGEVRCRTNDRDGNGEEVRGWSELFGMAWNQSWFSFSLFPT